MGVVEEKEAGGTNDTAKKLTAQPISYTASSDDPGELKTKYDELVQYTLMLEKEKKKLETDMQAVQKSKGSSSGDKGFTALHMILVAVLAFLLSYAAKFLG